MSANLIIPGIYQGSKPPEGFELFQVGIGMVVLTAEEHQPSARLFSGVRVIHLPLDDKTEPLTWREKTAINLVVQEIVKYYLKNKSEILITCNMGLNRSGLVTALTIQRILNCPMATAVKLVQNRRRDALCNQAFVEQLLQWY